jgi:hypothetical protein
VTKLKTLTRKNFARPAFQPWRVQNPSVPGQGYENTDFLYDSFSVAQAAAFPQMTPMFQVGISGTKTKAQTNMRTNGVLANSEMFKLRRVRVLITGCSTLADANNIAQLCSGVLNLGGRDFLTCPLMALPAAAGVQSTAVALPAAVGTLAYQNSIVNGDTNIHNAFKFEDEITLNNGESLQFTVTAETGFNMAATANGGTGATVYAFLDGRRLRPVS